ncbi:MAG: ATP synthase F0 subunit C [Planctomycetota bacterium]|nr:MAG: ATP synthase F0 subunit C [Planctomycetota bacterium]
MEDQVVAQVVNLAPIGASIAAGLGVLGAGLGIGKLASAALEGIARQPSAAGDLKGTMILGAALIEGVALFGVVVGLLALVL